jgi:CheY-like chemotaxis protein
LQSGNKQWKDRPLKRVLIVDDERSIADTLTVILRNCGYEATAAYNGESALQKCESFTPDIIISDIVLPGLNGIEMAIQIQQRHAECKILLLSGMAVNPDLLQQAHRQGYDFEFLAKPAHPAVLLSKLRA